MKISKEGIVIIPVAGLILFAAAALFSWLTSLVLPAFVLYEIALFGTAALITWGFVWAFFRVPRRPVLADENIVFSPCDGKVIGVEEAVEDEVTGEQRLKISIFMSPTNVHMNWFPVSGKVTYFKHHNGYFHIASHPKESDENEHTTFGVSTARHGVVVFRQIAGFVARRIVSYAKVGDQAVQNTPCGFIKFGSRMNIYLPMGTEILVANGQKTVGSQTPIARFQ